MHLRTRSLSSTDELAHLRGLSAFLPVNIIHTMGERSASTIAIERNGEPGTRSITEASSPSHVIKRYGERAQRVREGVSLNRGKDLRPEWSKSWAEPILATGVLTFKLPDLKTGGMVNVKACVRVRVMANATTPLLSGTVNTEKDYPVKIPKWVYDRITEITNCVVGDTQWAVTRRQILRRFPPIYGWRQTMMGGLYALSGISGAVMPVS